MPLICDPKEQETIDLAALARPPCLKVQCKATRPTCDLAAARARPRRPQGTLLSKRFGDGDVTDVALPTDKMLLVMLKTRGGGGRGRNSSVERVKVREFDDGESLVQFFAETEK